MKFSEGNGVTINLNITIAEDEDIPGTLEVQVQGVRLGCVRQISDKDEEPGLAEHEGQWIWEVRVTPANEYADSFTSSVDEDGLSFPNPVTAALNLLEQLSEAHDLTVGAAESSESP